jgi:FAD-linked sulfhydryl oxidase
MNSKLKLIPSTPRAVPAAPEIWQWPNVPKGSWGPRGWNWLHILAINYPETATREDARVAFRRIWNFVTHLPCDDCRFHAVLFVRRRPPGLAGSVALQIWVWRFHNAVNARLDKRLVSYDEYLKRYADELCWANWGAGCEARGAPRPG